jgi:hypothetical protein
MTTVNGVTMPGVAEATRLAQTIIQRNAEAGVIVVAGERAHRARAARVPEAQAAERVREREQRERRRRQEGRREDEDRQEERGTLLDVSA